MDEKLSPIEFMEKHHDGVYEFYYQMMKESVFEFYRWGLRTDNVDAMNFYKQMVRLYRTYYRKFMRVTTEKEQNVTS